MERRNYIWTFTGNEEETYAVIAHAGRYGMPKKGYYLPIKMQVKSCKRDGKKIDFTELIYSSAEEDTYLDVGFLRNRIDILHGKIQDWILVGFEPLMTGIRLWYYNKELDDKEVIYLHICHLAKKLATLNIEFEVPHANEKPDTQYLFTAECRCCPEDIAYNLVMLGSFSQDTQKSISFRLDEPEYESLDFDQYDILYPDWADVTEYTDI